LPTVLSAVVVLLRRHSITGTICNNQLCSSNNENDLAVTDVDKFGFVTEVTCNKCTQTTETTCHDAKWTYERIYDESQLKPGDHICWHRWYCIWHHAIVTTKTPYEIKVIHYNSNLEVEENDTWQVHASECSSCCDALYRVNYQDCYDAEYTVLRAIKLKNERNYNMLDRNCEHFSRWCKTGSTDSIQVAILWDSLRKMTLTTILRATALLVLGIIAYSHEAAEDSVRNHTELETLERWLTGIYVVISTMVFMTYLLITSGSNLQTVKTKGCCKSNPPLRTFFEWQWVTSCYRSNNWRARCTCCLCFCCLSFICRTSCDCILFLCRNIQCNPSCACCRRPCSLSCGLFWRIFCREILAACGTLCIVLLEEEITNSGDIAQWPAIARAAILTLFSMLAHIGGYILGVIVGRAVEACCECCKAVKTVRAPRNRIQLTDMP